MGGGSGDGVPAAEDVIRKLERDPQLFLVAEDASHVIGVVMGSYDGWRGWIFRLAVNPGRPRKGIGKALIEELERRFVDMGVNRVRLLVLGSNEAGRAFWSALDYDAFDGVVLYSKDLDAAR